MPDEHNSLINPQDALVVARRIVGSALGRPAGEIAMTDGLHTLPETDSRAQAEIVVAIESSTGLSHADGPTFAALAGVTGIQHFLAEHLHDV